jgi:hypothetical protein
MSILNKLTEGIVNRDLSKDGAALINKWEQTGLLEGLDDYNRNTMSVLLENQAKELLKETSTMATGDVEGFAAVAFPIVRRVFGSLVAQELVSVQPMSLPSGLIFFLDFTAQAPEVYALAEMRDDLTRTAPLPSVYGGNVVGSGIMSGVDLVNQPIGPAGMRNLKFGGSNARGGANCAAASLVSATAMTVVNAIPAGAAGDPLRGAVRFDPDILGDTLGVGEFQIWRVVLNIPPGLSATGTLNGAPNAAHPLMTLGAAIPAGSIDRMVGNDMTLPQQLAMSHVMVQTIAGLEYIRLVGGLYAAGAGADGALIKRLTRIVMGVGGGGVYGGSGMDTVGTRYLEFCIWSPGGNLPVLATGQAANAACTVTFAMDENLAAVANVPGAIGGALAWEEENSARIDEINIRVDSVAITAETKKLKATWTPELAQDLNAYHNLDAEVELTGLLSEQIALEIDAEILGDLLRGATADTYFWSRNPGVFVNRLTGTVLAAPPAFTGTVSEWYETLIETVNDISAQIHRKTLRGGANFLVCGPEVANILEFTAGFRANIVADGDSGMAGAMKTGSLSKKFDVYVTQAFPRNVVLVGRKGNSFLESGYVYAPYVPLQVTPTIFDPDDFTPRKAVMTRYGKEMVRPDMYGLVIVRDL